MSTLDELKRRAIKAVLEECDGDVTRAAIKMGIGKSALYQYLVEEKERHERRRKERETNDQD